MDRKPANTRKSPEIARITMRDVAREAGVSVGTVSRVMNNLPGVKPLSRMRVEQAAARLGWKPNSIAASMRTSSTRTIGCILPDIRNPLFAAIQRSAESLLRDHGYTLIVANSNDQLPLERNIVDLMLRRRVDGLIFSPSHESDPEIIRMVQTADVPVVLIERELPYPMDSVVSDQYGGLLQATEHLLSLGHRRIALVTGSVLNRPGRERHRGFMAAYRKAGLVPAPELMLLESLTAEYAFSAVQTLMSQANPPSAIITGGNLMLAGAMRALLLMEKHIPDDVSLIAVGDTDLAALAHPSFTTVRWDLDLMGDEAARALLARLQPGSEDAPTRNTVIPTEIILRGSCAAMQAQRA